MDYSVWLKKRIHRYYWEDKLNCATVALKILSEKYTIDLNDQVLHAAAGMHGAGKFGAQCGLVEGTLMFAGILGKSSGFERCVIENHCYCFAEQFEKEFGSLLCRILRPLGFKSDNPLHLCEDTTYRAMEFSISFLNTVV